MAKQIFAEIDCSATGSHSKLTIEYIIFENGKQPSTGTTKGILGELDVKSPKGNVTVPDNKISGYSIIFRTIYANYEYISESKEINSSLLNTDSKKTEKFTLKKARL